MSSLFNNPSGLNSALAIKLPLDRVIEDLEKRLEVNPGDKLSAVQLLRVLDRYMPSEHIKGTYTNCQRKLAIQLKKSDWIDELLGSSKNTAEQFKQWQAVIDSAHANLPVPVVQLLTGRPHYINNIQSRCPERLSLFKQEGVISGFCHDCFKVQILPLNLTALMQTYFVIRALKLPRDNARKCMVELREAVSYPYKGYIFCESEDEAKFCRGEFQKSLQAHQISDVYCGISHGCSEYGLKYPEFKYSNDGSHNSFVRPANWDSVESDFFSDSENLHPEEEDHNKQGLSLRDVIGFRTWIDYAEIIGDETSTRYRKKPTFKKPEPFATRVAKQSQMRKAQMEELSEKHALTA